jgi:luciferase family oxidoreductase group 1
MTGKNRMHYAAARPIALGLLDFCKVGPDGSTERGLAATIGSACLAERLGYKRYWLAEHWGAGVSTPSPELLTPIIAGMTERIRVGPAGVLLPFYSPLKVASNALLAESLFPGRTDLGLARGAAAPEVVNALAGRADCGSLSADYADKVAEVVAYLEGRGPVAACPASQSIPEVWVLGSSSASAPLAGQLGSGFALSLFHAGGNADPSIIRDAYRSNFRPSRLRASGPRACIAIAGVCADTDAKAQRGALAHTNPFIRPNVIGTPERWRKEITALCRRFSVSEVVVLELSRSPEDHQWAIEALARVFALEAEFVSVPGANFAAEMSV